MKNLIAWIKSWLKPTDAKKVSYFVVLCVYSQAAFRMLGAFGSPLADKSSEAGDMLAFAFFAPYFWIISRLLDVFGSENGYVFLGIFGSVFIFALLSLYVVTAAVVSIVEWIWSKYKKV